MNDIALDDLDLVELFELMKQGHNAAFATVYARHRGQVLRWVYNKGVRDDAQDVVQDCFVRLWEHIDAFDASRGASGRGWMMVVFANVINDHLRKLRSRGSVVSPDEEEDIFDGIAAYASVEEVARHHCIWDAWNGLTPEDRDELEVRLDVRGAKPQRWKEARERFRVLLAPCEALAIGD